MITRYSLKIFRICLWALLLTVFLCSTVPAFQYKDMDINVNATISEKYDDNINFSKENKKEDFITTLGLGVNAKYAGRRRSLDFSGNMNQRFNAKETDTKGSSENVSISFKNTFSRYDRINLGYEFNHFYYAETFEEELARATETIETTETTETYDNRFHANYSRDFSEHFRVNAKYAYRQKGFSSEDKEDTSYNKVGVEVHYKPGIATTFLVAYGYEENNLGYKINRYTGGVKYYITKRFYFDGRAGLNSSTSCDTSKSRANISVSLVNEIDESSVARISYWQGEEFDTEEGRILSNWRAEGGLTKNLLKKLNGSLSAFYGERTDEWDVTNTLLGVNTSLAYEVQEETTLSLMGTFADMSSTDATREYIRNTITLSLSRSF